MIFRTEESQMSTGNTMCPYCNRRISVDLPSDYAPIYKFCGVCGKKFIVERLAEGFQTLALEEAVCCSDPDCREMEMGLGDEE